MEGAWIGLHMRRVCDEVRIPFPARRAPRTVGDGGGEDGIASSVAPRAEGRFAAEVDATALDELRGRRTNETRGRGR